MDGPADYSLPDDLPEPIKEHLVALGDLLYDIAMHAGLDVEELEGQEATPQSKLTAVNMAMTMAHRCADLLQTHAEIIQKCLNAGWKGDMDDPIGGVAMACTLSLVDQCQRIISAATVATRKSMDGDGEKLS